MNIALKSIFEMPLERPELSPGIWLGPGWHIEKGQAWSGAALAQLTISSDAFPEPQPLLIRLRVFNAAPDRPRHLCVKSYGHDPIRMKISTAVPVTLMLQTPRHAQGAKWSQIGFELDHLDSPFLIGTSPDERLLGIFIKELVPNAPNLAFPLEFNPSGVATSVLAEGWAAPETNGVWSLGPRASLLLPGYLCSGGPVTLISEASVLRRPVDDAPLEIDVCEAGVILASWQFLAENIGPWRCTLPDWGDNLDRRIDLVVRNVRSPASLGINTDTRPLGLFLSRLSLL